MTGVSFFANFLLQSRRYTRGRFEPEPEATLEHIPMLVVTAERKSENKMPRDVPSALPKISRLWINVKYNRILFK